MNVTVRNEVKMKAGFGKYRSVTIDPELHQILTRRSSENMAIWNLLFDARIASDTTDRSTFRCNNHVPVQIVIKLSDNTIHFQSPKLH